MKKNTELSRVFSAEKNQLKNERVKIYKEIEELAKNQLKNSNKTLKQRKPAKNDFFVKLYEKAEIISWNLNYQLE